MKNPGDEKDSKPIPNKLLIFPTRKILLNNFIFSALKSVIDFLSHSIYDLITL